VLTASTGGALPSLFSPVELGALRLDNRIVMAPMTRGRASADRVPSALAQAYYGQRASAGLIITEATQISPEAGGYPNTPGIYRKEHAGAWRRVVDAIHARGGTVVLQLWHAGRIADPQSLPMGGPPVAPSAVAPAGEFFTPRGRRPLVTPRALEQSEVATIVTQFAGAARLAREVGFDGVDIHAANGYLIDQFLRDGSNRRTDGYGGSPSRRVRLLLEVTEAVCAVWGAERVGVRLSPLLAENDMHDSTPAATFGLAAGALASLGVAYLHVVEPGPGHPKATTEGQEIVRTMREVFGGRLMVDGGLDRRSAELALARTGADLVAFATPFIANPDLVERLAAGLPLAVADRATFYQGGSRGYIDYPAYAQSRAAL
jgi:N-ethylmaleimide reductase